MIPMKRVTIEKSYDWDALHQELRDVSIRPVIEHREFYRPNIAHDAGHEDDVYHRRSVVDAIFFALKHRFDETVDTGTWFGQFRESSRRPSVEIRTSRQHLTPVISRV